MNAFKPKYDIHNNEDGTYTVTATAPMGGFPPAKVTLNADQFDRFNRWRNSREDMIQNILGDISAGDREILLSGIGPEEWEKLA